MDTTTARVIHDGDTEPACYHCRYFTGHTDWCPAAESETDMTTTETIGADLVLATVPAGVALSTPAEAAARAEEIRGHLTLGFGKLTVAREKRDDLALGYPSWWAYVSGEFGDLDALGLPAEERRHVVSSMRADGMSQRVIAERLDTSVGTVNADLRKAGAQAVEVRGADGKVYPSSRERKAPEPVADPYAGLSRMEETVARVAAAGARGLTSIELDAATGWPMGTATANLCKQERHGRIHRSGMFRNNRGTYVAGTGR
jgi:RNA polymerase subunit RPABC4/transcription elongation factor Spt4